MTEAPVFVIDDDDSVEWVEINRLEALQRLENMLTVDLVAFEIDADSVESTVGTITSYIWFRVTDEDDQLPVLVAQRDPAKPEAPLRWFLHRDLVTE